jgi:hypothetical protein
VIDIVLGNAERPHPLEEKVCRIRTARREIGKVVARHAEIVGDPIELLTVHGAELAARAPPLLNATKQIFDGGAGRHGNASIR